MFLTGDLGFKALEPLREALGRRFINAGVAEQNMVSVGAGLARAGLRPWVYSIAPFVYARPFEQIRNDVCLHRLPVVLVGNGGGYGYGVMGATHHALEDYGALLCLPHLRAYVPAFDARRPRAGRAAVHGHRIRPTCGWGFRRSRRASPCRRTPRGGSWSDGRGWVVLVAGPLVGGIWEAVRQLDAAGRPTLWLLSELPLGAIPEEFWPTWPGRGRLLVVEEHVAQGGVGQMIAERPAGSAAWRRSGSSSRCGPGLSLGTVRLAEVPPPRVRARPRGRSSSSSPPRTPEMSDDPSPPRPRSPRRSAGSRARSSCSAPAASSAPT